MIDDKFIDGFIDDAEKVSSENSNIYFINGNQANSKHIKNPKAKWISFRDDEFISTLKKATKDDKIFVHWYDLKTGLFLLKYLKKEVPLYVYLWGGEFYEDPYLHHMNWIHDEKTLTFVKEHTILPEKYYQKKHFFKRLWFK
jgi:hypothetical protein